MAACAFQPHSFPLVSVLPRDQPTPGASSPPVPAPSMGLLISQSFLVYLQEYSSFLPLSWLLLFFLPQGIPIPSPPPGFSNSLSCLMAPVNLSSSFVPRQETGDTSLMRDARPLPLTGREHTSPADSKCKLVSNFSLVPSSIVRIDGLPLFRPSLLITAFYSLRILIFDDPDAFPV